MLSSYLVATSWLEALCFYWRKKLRWVHYSRNGVSIHWLNPRAWNRMVTNLIKRKILTRLFLTLGASETSEDTSLAQIKIGTALLLFIILIMLNCTYIVSWTSRTRLSFDSNAIKFSYKLILNHCDHVQSIFGTKIHQTRMHLLYCISI